MHNKGTKQEKSIGLVCPNRKKTNMCVDIRFLTKLEGKGKSVGMVFRCCDWRVVFAG